MLMLKAMLVKTITKWKSKGNRSNMGGTELPDKTQFQYSARECQRKPPAIMGAVSRASEADTRPE